MRLNDHERRNRDALTTKDAAFRDSLPILSHCPWPPCRIVEFTTTTGTPSFIGNPGDIVIVYDAAAP